MKSFSCYCQGESHKSTDKPCQDRAYNKDTKHLSMAIVCDGHGVRGISEVNMAQKRLWKSHLPL